MNFDIPVLGICARTSGMGKTTLLAALLPQLATLGLRISVIKQTHASWDLDQSGKDSYRMREAGAAQVLLSSPERWALLTETEPRMDDGRLLDMLQHLDPTLADLVLVEGFRAAPIAKIEVYRAGHGHPPLAFEDSHIVALASDTRLAVPLPHFHLDDIPAIARFIQQWLERHQPAHKLVAAR